MLTIEQRRERLQDWYDKFGLDSLLDKCAIDLHSFANRCRELRYERDDLAKQLKEGTKHD